MVDIMFPQKGWSTVAPRISQPDGTSADLLNVMPFDRDYRSRGSIRSGLSKYAVTQLGGGSPVLLVGQVTSAVDPSTITASTLILDEEFVYANGDLNVVSGGVWSVTNANYNFGGSSSTHAVVSADTLTTGTNTVACRYTPALTLGSAYVIKTTMTVASFSANWIAGIMFRGDPLNLGNALSLTFQQVSGVIYLILNSAAGADLGDVHPITTLTAGVPFTLELHVNGNLISGYVNGLLVLGPLTNSTYLSNSAVGLTLESNAGGFVVNDFQVYIGSPLSSYRSTKLVAVSGGNIYVGDDSGLAVATSGSGALSPTIKPQMAQFANVCYFVDSFSHLKTLTMSTQVVADIVPSAGTDTATTLGAYTLACMWRGRLVLAASAAFPQNFVMARQNVPTDWDYSQLDAAAAVAGNASKVGAIGDPLNALIPWTDDVLILGGDHSIFQVQGDIAAGGSILLISDAVGMLGPDSWDVDPEGFLYFVGTSGLYRMAVGGEPMNISSDSIRDFFAGINRTNTYVVATWDRDRNGLHIHLTPVNTGATTHLFFAASQQNFLGTSYPQPLGFFPVQYPNAIGPMTAIVFDGDGPLDRQLLLAGRDGYIRKVDPDALDDDGTDISSYVQLGPFRPGGDAALSVLEALEIVLGDAPAGFTEADFGLNLSIITGKDVYTALNSPERTLTFSFTKQARRKRLLQRLSGGTFFFKISGVAGKLWSLEKLIALFTGGGLQRRY